ncbi:MAG: shikimate kinase [Desulfuromonas sp.]|nr:MAG: shikimate kinase [Desulfuromonas sp.]
MNHSNIILIGMPGAGKSTIGVILAKRIGFDFIDTDLLIQRLSGKSLQTIINEDGLDHFRRVEEEVLLGLETDRTVIATGGSAVYSPEAMQHLKKNGLAVFINTPLQTLQTRIADMSTRGMVISPGESFTELFIERNPLYHKYADRTVNSHSKTIEIIADEIATMLAGR